MTNYEKANCLDADPAIFDDEHDPLGPLLCRACDVRSGCLQDALDAGAFEQMRGGFWFDSHGKVRMPRRLKVVRAA